MIINSMLALALAAVSAEGQDSEANKLPLQARQTHSMVQKCTEVSLQYRVGGSRRTIWSEDCRTANTAEEHPACSNPDGPEHTHGQ